MEVRILRQQELLPALRLVWEVFAEDVAPLYTPEGVAEFQKFIRYEGMLQAFQSGEVIFFGAFEDGKLCGTMAVKNTGHICLFYVKKDCQGKGVGRMLFQAVSAFCAQQLKVNRMTVNAAPSAAPKYQHMGMRPTGEERQENGIRYVPMEMSPVSGSVQPAKKNRTGLIVGGIIGGILLLAVILVIGIFAIRSSGGRSADRQDSGSEADSGLPGTDGDDDPMAPDSPIWNNRGDADQSEGETEETTGLDAIQAHIEDGLTYKISEDVYEYTDEEAKSSIVSFHVEYPKIDGLEGMDEKINATIRTCAMATVDRIYNSPSQEFKEKILGTQNPVLASSVNYKVCYANNDFISIIFEDACVEGSRNDFHSYMRTLNIGLRDAKVYTVDDIVSLNDDFIDEWLETMREEAGGDDKFLSELNRENMKSTLAGKRIGGNYIANFFVKEGGVEIGYNFVYPENDPDDLGFAWVTAPFSFEEIKPYEKDENFWGFFE